MDIWGNSSQTKLQSSEIVIVVLRADAFRLTTRKTIFQRMILLHLKVYNFWFHSCLPVIYQYTLSVIFHQFTRRRRKRWQEKVVRFTDGFLVKWCSVDICQKTLQCWLPYMPDMAVTTVTGSGWGYKLVRMEYFRVTKRGHRKPFEMKQKSPI